MSKKISSSSSSSGSIGFFGALAIAFIVLKLMGIIEWPWIWVLSPLWGGCLLGLAVLGIILIFIIVATYLEK